MNEFKVDFREQSDMGARLVVTAGPLQGTLVDLTEPRLGIGRSGDNQVSLPSRYASRHHCRIQLEAKGYIVADLGSSNGTFVNEVPVKERRLEHGDQIRVGDSVFLFVFRDDEAPMFSNSVELAGDMYTSETTLEVPFERVRHLQERGALADMRPPELAVGDLRALLKISSAISAPAGVEALQRDLLETIVDIIPADRGAILLTDSRSGEISSRLGWDRTHGEKRSVEVSESIVRRVLDEGVAILSKNTLTSEPRSKRRRGGAPRPAIILAVPLAIRDRKLGAIYLEADGSTLSFEDSDLELLTAIAGLAALAFDNTRHLETLEGENERLLSEMRIKYAIVGESPAMRVVHEFIAKVAPTDSSVLITGETGTGKELVARAIHDNSARARGPYVGVNCAALAETLIESELFGYERGAFTGAVSQKKGKFEFADGGTLLLDEIGELSLNLQVKLLRVLEEHQFERVGGTRAIKVDVRVIAATNRDLERAIRDGLFRQDLYYRLNVVSLTVPPLREREEDISLLANYFAVKCGTRCNRRVWGVSEKALQQLKSYSWPGNVRELENAIERAAVLGSGDFVQPEDLPETVLEAEPVGRGPEDRYQQAVLIAKKSVILDAFKEANGNLAATARLLGIHPNHLHRLIRSMNLKKVLREDLAKSGL